MKLCICFLAALLAAPVAWADLTLRYRFSVEPGAGLPPETAAGLQGLANAAPLEVSVLVRGDLARTEALGRVTLLDLHQRQAIALDAPTRRLAVAGFDEYRAALPSSAALASAQATSLYAHAEFRVEKLDGALQGEVAGIRAERQAAVIIATTPQPQGPPLEIRIEMRLWRPLEAEMARLPQLQEYARWAERDKGVGNPLESVERTFAAAPGLGAQMARALALLSAANSRPALRVEAVLSVPVPASAFDQLRRQGAAVPEGLNFRQTLLETRCELVQMTAGPLANALFNAPSGYRAVPIRELLSAQPAAPSPAPNTIPAGLTMPSVIFKRDPEYTEAAQKAGIRGAVVLNVVVGPDGVPRDPHISRSLTPELDQRAIDAVLEWRFRPGEKDGKPVSVRVNVQVNFRLAPIPPPAAK